MTGKNTIKEALLTFEQEELANVVRNRLDEGSSPHEIINEIVTALKAVGDKFEKGDLFLIHLVAVGEAAKNVIAEHLEPLLKKEGDQRKAVARVLIGTVAGDIHDIGKDIVATMLFIAGFEVIDLGRDVPTEEFVKAVEQKKPDIVALSALLTTTLPVQREVIEALTKNNLRASVKIMVGGAPATADWAKEIGADGYGQDAVETVEVAKKLLKIG
jgi:corrinoid protein of di/trimethylamine methyltransferase